MGPQKSEDRDTWKRLRTHFFMGVVVLTPLAVTAYVFWRLFNAIDGVLRGLLTKSGFFELIGRRIPGIGFISLVVPVIFIGMLTRNLVGRKMIELGDTVISRIPLVNQIYMTVQQISKPSLRRRPSFAKPSSSSSLAWEPMRLAS
jgi:uncharacterized membrane protein